MYSTSQKQKSQRKRMPVYRSDGRMVGDFFGDTLIKHVSASRHMLRSPKAWAFDKHIIDQAKRAGLKYVEIHDRESGLIYKSNLDNFIWHGISFNRGFGAQIALKLEKWTVTNPNNTGERQLEFFGSMA